MSPWSLAAILVAFALVASVILWHSETPLPDRWNPLAPVDIAEAPNFLTPYKLRRLRDEPGRCHALLGRAGFDFEPVPDRETGDGCGFRNAVRIAQGGVSYGGGIPASCPLAVGLALFERHVLQPAAREAFGQPVVRIEHYGSYACRNIYHREGGPRSEHATANAIDVVAFRLADGRRIAVAGGWDEGGAREAFLRRVRDGACDVFKGVLGPAHDAAHADHFHFDVGARSVCR